MRPLTQVERAFLGQYFGASLALDRIRLGPSMGRRSWSPYGARISLVTPLFEAADPARPVKLESPYAAAVFAHEAVHVWQRQHGRAVTREGALLQAGYILGLHNPYAYDASLRDARALLSVFVLGNIEQQGKIFEDYVYAERTGRDTRRFDEVVTWVRLSGSK